MQQQGLRSDGLVQHQELAQLQAQLTKASFGPHRMLVGQRRANYPKYEVVGRCTICDCVFTSRSAERAHLAGKRHNKMLEKQVNDQRPEILQIDEAIRSSGDFEFVDGKVFCKVCQVYMTGLEVARTHYNGVMHGKSKKAGQPVKKATKEQKTIDMTKAEIDEAVKNSFEQIRSDNQILWRCNVCKIGVSGEDVARDHVQGRKHNKQRAAIQLMSDDKEISNCEDFKVDGPHAIACCICKVLLNGIDMARAHKAGSKHAQMKRKHQSSGPEEMNGNGAASDRSQPTGSGAPVREPRAFKAKTRTHRKLHSPFNHPDIEESYEGQGPARRINGFVCKVCSGAAKMTGPQVVWTHLQGAAHLKNKQAEQDFESLNKDKGIVYTSMGKGGRCLVCAVDFTSASVAQTHLKGIKHVRRVSDFKKNNATETSTADGGLADSRGLLEKSAASTGSALSASVVLSGSTAYSATGAAELLASTSRSAVSE